MFETDPCEETRWTYITLLLLEGQGDKAAELFTPALESRLAYEHAYTLYRRGDFKAAKTVIESLSSSSSGPNQVAVQGLLGQVLYKLEEYDSAALVYKSLLSNPDLGDASEIPVELKANFGATCVGSSLGHRLGGDEASQAYELLFNDATRALGAGEFDQAEEKLDAALDLAVAVLGEDGFSPDEIEEEVASIKAQKAYVLQMTGRVKEALAVYGEILEAGLADETVLAVANNNVTCARGGESDLFDSMKKSSKASAEVLRRRLTKSQRNAIALNRALLFMYMSKFDQARALVDDLNKSDNDNDDDESVTPIMILAALHYREGKIGKAVSVLEEAATQANSVPAQLALAQLAYNEKRLSDVLAALDSERLDSIRHTPAFVGTHVALLESAGEHDRAVAVLDAALEANPDSEGLVSGVAASLLKSGEYARATMLYSQLLASNPDSVAVRARLVKALAYTDVTKAEQVAADLPNADIPASVPTAEELEAALLGGRSGGPSGGASRKGKENAESVPGDGAKKDAGGSASASESGPAGGRNNPDKPFVKKPKRKRKKKNPPAKNANPDKAPDPFRWVAKRDRPGYKSGKRGRKNRHKIDTSTQGASPSDAGDIAQRTGGGNKKNNNKKNNKKNNKRNKKKGGRRR